MIYLSIFLTLSILINILLIWYIKNILTKLLFISENSDDLLQIISNFSDHLASIYEMETFYGEPILQSLVQHSRHVVNEIKDYSSIYTLDDTLDDLLEEEEDEEG